MVLTAAIPADGGYVGPTDRRERRLIVSIAIFMVVVAFPFKFLFYLAPVILLVLTASSVPLVAYRALATQSAVFLVLGFFSVALQVMGGRQVNWWGLPFGLYTYSMALIALSSNGKADLSPKSYDRIGHLCLWYILVQSGIGLVQYVVARDGDYVSGSFGLTDFLTRSKTISQVNYTFTLFMMIVFLLQFPITRMRTVILFIGIVACILAQSGHQTMMFLATTGMMTLVFSRRRASLTGAAIVTLPILLVLVLIYPETWTIGEAWLEKIFYGKHSPKRELAEAVLDAAKSPGTLLFGLGVGQCCSRAALFLTGNANSVPLPDVIVGASSFFRAHVYGILADYRRVGENSAMAKPSFSLLAFPAEFGVVGTGLLAARLIVEFRRNRWRAVSPIGVFISPGLYCVFFLVFLLLCSLIEDYFELTQAIAIPVMLYLTARARGRQSA